MTVPEPAESATSLLVEGQSRYQVSTAWHRRASQVAPGGVHSTVRLGAAPIPLFFEHGSGAHLFDVDGNRYIDFALGMGPDILGHAHPRVTEAAQSALGSGQLFAGQHPAEVQLAEKFVSMVPSAELVRFCGSGTEAVQAAIRLARGATGRTLLVKFDGHYHGWLDNVYLNMAPSPTHTSNENSFESRGQSKTPGIDVVSLPWNDAASLADFMAARGHEVAAVIMEPIMANTSLVLPRAGYLELARTLCDAHGAILIFDEVITGFRVGPGGAQEAFGVSPDLATYGKAMANGFPISAVGGRRSILELAVTANVVLSGTYNANCVSVVTALATLNELDTHVYASMRARGERLRQGISAAGAEAGLPVRTQGLGTMFIVYFAEHEVVDYESHTRTDAAMSEAFIRELLDLGVRPTSRGTWFLSTAHTDDDIDQALDAVASAFGHLAQRS